MLVRVFRAHGQFCASHPWEVIVATLTLTACMLSVDKPPPPSPPPIVPPHCPAGNRSCLTLEDYNAVDVIVMTTIRCIAVLYSYYQFCNLHKLGSKYILGIAGLFTVFSSFVFSSSVINFMRSDISDLKDALFFFLLLVDLSKATLLAQFALSSASQREVTENIARGVALLGPTITLDTIVETLVISVGTLSGVKRLELLCCYACMSAVVNYIVFMTFYPACLSMILELSRSDGSSGPVWHNKSILRALKEEDQKPNPVVQRVKMIMSAGLVVVHIHSRWALKASSEESTVLPLVSDNIGTNSTDDAVIQGQFIRWITGSADHIVILILLLALTVKFIFFEDKEELTEQLLMSSATASLQECHHERSVDSSLRHRFAQLTSLERDSGVDEGWVEVTSSRVNASMQTSEDRTPPSDQASQTEAAASDRAAVVTESRPSQTERSVAADGVAREDKGVQTGEESDEYERRPRPVDECVALYKQKGTAEALSDTEVRPLVKASHIPMYQIEKAVGDPERGVGIRRQIVAHTHSCPQGTAEALSDTEVRALVKASHIPMYQIEKAVGDPERGVGIRRQIVGAAGDFTEALHELPYRDYDYSKVLGACCENVIGYVPVPCGVAGPLLLDGSLVYVPMATTEGCLVASTNRGARALLQCGVRSRVVADGMTRGPVVRFPSMTRASEAMAWMQTPANFQAMKEGFDASSRFARLTKLHVRIAGRLLFIRFVATTGDAMGMNMLSKGTEMSLKVVQQHFPDMELLSLSGNFCADKKPAAVNWIEGRGKSVVCEAVVPGKIVTSVLKTSVAALIDVNLNKNLIGSAVAGSIGGFNAHAANIVTAIFIATGQDPAQNVSSSNCMTLMEPWGEDGRDLYISCTMPSVEIGTVGGGTQLPAQAACLDMLGVRGPHSSCPGENANTLARIVCGTVLAGELSLMSALAAGHLVRSHLRHNRSSTTTPPSSSFTLPSLSLQPSCTS